MKSRPTHFKRLLKFLRRKGRSHEDAEDLIQEAMLRLHLYGRTVPVVNEEAFLRQAVTNLSIDQHRRDRPDLRKEVPIEEANARSPLIAAEATPEQTLEAEQRAGYSYAEIADHMNISHITIKRHIARALLAIMEHGDRKANGTAHRLSE